VSGTGSAGQVSGTGSGTGSAGQVPGTRSGTGSAPASGSNPWSSAAPAVSDSGAAAAAAPDREARRQALSDAARHLPADSAFVFGLAFREAREDAAIGKVVQAALDNSPYLAELRLLGTACQIDITGSLDWLAVGLLPPPVGKGRPRPAAPPTPSDDQLDVVASGSWSRDRVEQCILRVAGGPDQLAIDRDGAVTRIGAPVTAADPPAGERRATKLTARIPDRWLGWIDDHTFLMSTRPTADAAWIRARLAGDASAAVGTAGIAPQLASVDRRSALWFAGDGEQILGEPLIDGAPRARALFGRIDLGSELRFDVTLRYATGGDAGKVKLLMDQRLADLAAGQDLSMFGRFEVAQQAADLHLGAQLTSFATLMVGSALDSALAEAPKPTPKP
jgi:hypothetical protein